MDIKTLKRYLYQLAGLYNIQVAYYDVSHNRRQASVESLLAVIKALGAPLDSPDDVASALREKKQVLHQRILEPVTVAWNGNPPEIRVCVPDSAADISWYGYLETEDGTKKNWKWRAAGFPVIGKRDIEGTGYLVKQIDLPESLPWGYHKFSLEMDAKTAETLIISSPGKAYLSPEESGERMWGVFIPLYALYHRDNPGVGDYAALGSLADWVSSLGGRTVATLPLLPTFLDELFEPSPYAPVSRLLWNEFYVNLESVAEFHESSKAQSMLQSKPAPGENNVPQDKSLVDYRRLMTLKRRVLEECCHSLITRKTARFQEFNKFIQANPLMEDYARFRATMENLRSPWTDWPERLRNGTLDENDYDEGKKLYHMYSQWLAHQQVQGLADEAREKDIILYFDLPLGTHPEGYDVWRRRDNFALEATAGAPPDSVFTWGQDWHFPPIHPERIREQGYRYVREYLRHHLQQAGMLRIDHIMGLYRLYWIPKGLEARQGVYVRYRAEELYAILTLESLRHRSVIVGEDLGTVPSYVRPSMSRHGLQRMYVLHYELADSDKLHHPQSNAIASLNTHDMPPFASFWQGLDIPERQSLGLLNKKSAQIEMKDRQKTRDNLANFLRKKNWLQGEDTDVQGALKACLSFLSASLARVVFVNLEDLWLETRSQNVPSTDDRNPNWRRKAGYALEEFCQLPEVRDTLEEVNRLRKQAEK